MLSERCSVWQRIGSKNEKTHETRTHLVGQSRSGRDLKARTTVEKTDAADDSVSSIEDVDSAALHAVSVERNEPNAADFIGAQLAAAMHAWCTTRDSRRLRRTLLALLSALDDE